MTDAEKVQAIINAIQNDSTLLLLLRLTVTNSLNSMVLPNDQLDALVHALGLE